MAKKLTSTKAKKILHDKTVHGKPLTDKQRKFFGAVASGAIPQAQNGIEGTMGGLTDIGFNYNGAWGGTMAMGGGIPGAVGFTYARTGSIPSNGPYAKKTKASAQDGKNVEYMELPEITVVGSKDKGTRDFYNNLIDTLSKGLNTNSPFINQEVMGKYLGMMNLGKEYGFPRVKPATKSGIYKNSTGQYAPLTKTIYANDPNTWIAEMAHHVQMKDNVVGKGLQWLGNDLIEYIKQPIASFKGEKLPSPYEKVGAVEHEAHSIIEPMLRKKVKNARIDYRNSPVSEASKKRFLYENRNLQNGGEMKYYQEGLDFKPKTISQDGSILTPYGQWEYPGEITTIPSNEITMQGVPYPVLGISDIGDVQMMYPGEDYTFDGKSVTEYPMAQDGWLSKIDNVLSAPARGVTKLITGKYQDPSEALDIKNPYLKLATDMILDPVNLIGVGAVSKLTKLARGVKTIEKTKDVFNPKVAATLEGMLKSPAGRAAQRKFGPLTGRRTSHKSFWKAYDELLPKVWDKVKVEKAVKLGATDAITTTAIINDLIQKYPEHKDEIIKSYGSSKTINQSKGQLKSQPTPSNTSPVVSKPKSKPSYVEKFGALDYIEEVSKPKASKKVKPQSTSVAIKQQPVLPAIERKQNIYEGTPVYSSTVGSGGPSALIGFANQKGDTTFIKPEDYERFGVPKYGREYIEKATNKFRDGGVSVNEADAQPIKKLDQLLNFTNYNDMAKAKKGKKLPKAQFGIPSEYNLNLAQYDPKTQMFNSPTGRISMFDTTNAGFTNAGSKMGAFNNINDVNKALGDMGGIGGASTQLLGGIQQLMEERKQKQKTKQFAALSDVASQAATSRPVGIQRRYIEQPLVEAGSPYGSGLDFLQMEDGGLVGGNPTEIQNMYNPGTLYSDLGYEPLDDSNQVKQFEYGGKAQFGTVQAGQLGSTFGSFLGGGSGAQSGAGQVGSAVGGIAGNLLLPGVGGVIGSALGGTVGGLIGGQSQKKMEQMQMRAQGNLGTAALQQSLQGQFSGFMEDGGELKYLSNDWQPQVITKFGEYDVKDLLKAPKDADMLRAGGHLKEYTAPSERAMQTYAMGGELQTHWGGYAETISENPYLPDGGETVMFRGQSHEESDGKGRTGIGITYGDNPVEVERGEPAVKLKDGGTGQDSMVVFGNMKIPSYGASELNDPKAKGMKFKRYAEDLSKIENKANKVSDKALKLIDENSGDTAFDMLSLSTANIMMKGSDMKLKDAAMKKQLAAGIQSAILDTAEELGLENDALAKGKIKSAKGGGKFSSAQMGTALPNSYTDIMFNKFGPFNPLEEVVVQGVKPKGNSSKTKVAKAAATAAPIKRQMATLDFKPRELTDDISPIVEIDSLKTTTPGIEKLKSFKAIQPEEDKFDLLDFANMLSPYTRPLLRNPLDPGQLAPEMMALATNVVEPVQAQQFRPMLEQTPTVSFQDQLNEIQAESNAARRLVGNNPAGQAAISAQAAAAKNKVLGEQLRTNQMLQLESRRRNLATLNDATLKNLGILDQQFMRQSQARSATKAQAQLALNSIADKIARNKAETLQANVMSNMYPQYTFGPKGRVFNTGLTRFNIPTVAENVDKKMSRNGSIVKAIKNL